MKTHAETSGPEQIEIDAVRTPIADIAAYLQEHIGQKPTAYLSGLNDAKTVGQWAAGKVMPRRSASLRLRHGYQAVRILNEAFGDETAMAWLFGINSQLENEAPAYVLRHAKLPEEMSRVVRAGRGFGESGHGLGLGDRIRDLETAQRKLEARVRELITEMRRPAEESESRVLKGSGKAGS